MKAKTIAVPLSVLTCSSLILIGNYVYSRALLRYTKKEDLNETPDLKNDVDIALDAKEGNFSKMKSINKIQLKITSFDGLTLNAYMYEQKIYSKKWVIIVHGYNCYSDFMESYTRHFYSNNFNVIAPDCRGHGESEGNYIGMGWHDRLDVISWINKIIEKDPNSEIVLFGISMGAASILSATGENLPRNLKCAISDCSYSDGYKIIKNQIKSSSILPIFPFATIANIITKFRSGYFISDAKPINQVKKSKTPTLFIHSDQDKLIPFEMAYDLYENASCVKDMLIIKDAGHGYSSIVEPNLYWKKIEQFTNKYLSS